MLSARAAKCVGSGRGRRKGALWSISFAMTRSRRATSATAVEKVFTEWGNATHEGLVAYDYAWGVALYSRTRMKVSPVRLVAVLALTGQMLPVGLPLLCDQVQQAAPANCDRQMTSHSSGPVLVA